MSDTVPNTGLYKWLTGALQPDLVFNAFLEYFDNFFGSNQVAGKHMVPLMAGAIRKSASGGCSDLNSIASSGAHPDITTVDFDPTTQEYAQFSFPLPKSWNGGTFTFIPVWSHPATATNFGVVWDLQLVVVRNDDSIDTSFGTAIKSTDTGGTTNDVYYGPESTAITVAGTAADNCLLCGRISRVTSDGSDTMAVDARLHGIQLFMTTDKGNDA